MTAAERTAAIAGARANVRQKRARLVLAQKAETHARLMYAAAVEEWLDLVSERHADAPASTPAEPWCAGNPARRTEELL